MSAVDQLTSGQGSQASKILAARGSEKKPGDVTAKDAFQDFVAGTFFQQMLKSLRSTQEKPAYFHGGQAEEMFQSQLDQQVASDLAKSHGGAFSDGLFDAFSRQMRAKGVAVSNGEVKTAYADDAGSTSSMAVTT